MWSHLRIVFVSHQGNLKGGADQSLLTLLKALKPNLEPLIITPLVGDFTNELDRLNIAWLHVPLKPWIDYRNRPIRKIIRRIWNMWQAKRIAHQLRSKMPDAIYTNTLYSPFGAMLARELKVPHIWHAREYVQDDMGADYDWGIQASLQFVSKQSDLIICNSQAIQAKLQPYIQSTRTEVVYNGVTQTQSDNKARKARPSKDSEIHLVIIGRVHLAKGQEEAIRALPYLKQAGYSPILHIAGTGTDNYTEQLQHLAIGLEVAEHIVWHGYTDIEALIPKMDVTMVCSRAEAFGRVVAESMAMGCPVIGADIGAIPELIEHGETGLHYPLGDSKILAEQIIKLVTDERLYASISTNALAYSRREFNPDTYTDRLHALIEKVIYESPR